MTEYILGSIGAVEKVSSPVDNPIDQNRKELKKGDKK